MKLSIVTLSYNSEKDISEFFDSLQKLGLKGLETKVVMVDNASSDNTVETVSKKYPQADIVQTGGNFGFTGGFNRGIEYSLAWGADYLLIVNPDVIFTDSSLVQKLLEILKSDPKIGLVTPKIYFTKGFEFHKDRYSPESLGKVIWYGGGSFDWNNCLSIHRGIDEVDSGQYDKVEETGFISGCCFLTKAEVFNEVGFFDTKLFAYMEDNDFLERVKEKGYKLFYNGETSISHKVSQSFEAGSKLTDYFLTRNRLYFGMKYAKKRTKFALWREALKFILMGRPFQRRGALDYFKRVTGAPTDIIKPSQNPKYQIKLSVAIVNYNTSNLVKKLLESIYDPKSGIGEQPTEVILLDNGNLDPCDKFVKDFPEVRYIVNQENVGFSRGYNRCIKFSRGEHILMLNSDIELLEKSLSLSARAADEKRGEAVIIGKLYFPDRSDQDSVFKLPTISGAFKAYVLTKPEEYFMYLPKGDNPIRVEGAAMAVFLIPRKVVNKVGLIDEGTFMYFEDVEYCRRLKRSGVPIYFYPKIGFIHHHGASSKKLKEGEAYKLLVKGSIYYHGKFYYKLLYLVLFFGQKLGRIKTPVAR